MQLTSKRETGCGESFGLFGWGSTPKAVAAGVDRTILLVLCGAASGALRALHPQFASAETATLVVGVIPC